MEQEYPPSLLCEGCRSQKDSLCPIDPRLLNSNHIPSTAEVFQMLELLKEETKELDQCKTEMVYLGPKLDQPLKARKKHLEAHIKRRRYITSTQRKLPVELWEKIFAIVCSSSPKNSYDGGPYSLILDVRSRTLVMTPITLTHVCSRWRVIITGCPRLWASIDVDIYDRYFDGTQRLVETFLANSGACPLNLQIHVEYNKTTGVQAIWEILTHHISRSDRLYLNLANHHVDDLFQDRNMTFNNLLSFVGKRLRRNSWDMQSDINNSFWKALRQAPKLTNVQLDSVWPFKSFPHSQLTTLRIDCVYLSEIGDLLQLLEVSINLHSLYLNILESDVPVLSSNIPHVELLFLRKLTLCGFMEMVDPRLDALFSALIMPGLITLNLSCMPSRSPGWPSSLLIMLQHSSMTLKYMSLSLGLYCAAGHFRLSNRTFAPLSILLELVPHLTFFDLYDMAVLPHRDSPSTWLSTELMCVPPKRPILPELKTLSIRSIPLDSDTMDALLTFATSRSHSRLFKSGTGIRPLKKLRVERRWVRRSPVWFTMTPRMQGVIEDLKLEGMKVIVS